VPGAPTVRDAIDRLERSRVPVVAAIDGLALGAGLEVALACDYRVAGARAKLGLPEITLGLLPGAGGTQRLPRLIGVPKALEIILGGKTLPAKAALRRGMIDEIALHVTGPRPRECAFVARDAVMDCVVCASCYTKQKSIRSSRRAFWCGLKRR